MEADDVIGTVAKRAIEDGFLVAIASPDKVGSPDGACMHFKAPYKQPALVLGEVALPADSYIALWRDGDAHSM